MIDPLKQGQYKLFAFMRNHDPSGKATVEEYLPLRFLAPYHGRIIRYRELGRALGVSHHSVEHRISALVSAGVLRRLDPLQLELAGFMIEQIMARIRSRQYQFYFYGRVDGPHIDLILERKGLRIGFLFRFKDVMLPRDWSKLKADRRRGLITRGLIIYRGSSCFFATRDVLAVSSLAFLEKFDLWIDEKRPLIDVRTAIREYNAEVVRYYRRALEIVESAGKSAAELRRSGELKQFWEPE